jgi:hypothetical protein
MPDTTWHQTACILCRLNRGIEVRLEGRRLGLDFPREDGTPVVTGVAPNELTAADERDWLAGPPSHKHVRARIEVIAEPS